MNKFAVIVLIICVFVMFLALFFYFTAENIDARWVEADGDVHEAYEILRGGADTPRDHLRNARIYTRTLAVNNPHQNRELQERGRIEYNRALIGAPLNIIEIVLDDMGFGMFEAPALAQHQAAIQRAREGVFVGEVTRDEYLEQVQEWVDDGESVHDNKTSTGLRKILARAREHSTPMGEAAAAEELQEYIYSCDLAPPRKAAALNVLKEICASGFNATYDDDEPRILADIWARARENENAREAVAIALADGQRKGGGIVCSTGRVGRVIAALDGVDPLMEGLSSSPAKIHRDKIFHEVQQALTAAKEAARKSGHGDIADAYDGKGTCDEESPAYKKFAESLRQDIDNIVDASAHIFRKEELERIREECYVIL